MKVISGKYRGRRIETVSSKKLRPTTGMAREALFNILSHGQFNDGENSLLDGCKVLDLYCGCGALSIEALSRGAEAAVLIDIDQDHLNIARKNLITLGEEANCSFIRGDSACPPPSRFPCNLIFIDPPYGEGLVNKSLKNLISGNWLEEDAVIVIESGKKEKLKLPDGFEELENRTYGNSRIQIVKWLY